MTKPYENSSELPPDVKELLAAASNRQLSAEQSVRLNALLVTDPAVRKAYVQYMHLEASLHHLLSESIPGPGDTQSLITALMEVSDQSSDQSLAVPPKESRPLLTPAEAAEPLEFDTDNYQLPDVTTVCGINPRRPFYLRPRVLLAAATLFIVACVTVALLADRHHPMIATPAASGEATLASSINATWEEPAVALVDGQRLPDSVLKLHSGMVRLNVSHGVSVVIEGPADFQMDSAARLSLLRGSMTAHVPTEGVGFTVVTPQARVQDLGTEFGVYVDDDSRTHAEVFTGRVRVSIDDGKNVIASRVLLADKAVQIADGAITMQDVNLQPLAFVRPAQYAAIENENGNLSYARWSAFSEQLRHQSNLLAYYSFDNESSAPTKLLNRSIATAGHSDGTLEGATWDDGRFPSKRALRFDGDAHVRFAVPNSTKSLTLAAWVNFDSFSEPPSPRDHQFMALMLSDGSRQSAVHWQIMDGKRMELSIGVNDDNPVPFERYRTPNGLSANHLNKWTMLAVVFDRENSQVRHYINGRQTNISPITAAPDPIIGNAQIGNWDEVGSHYRALVGRIDELAIVGRSMSRQEIEAMYEAGGGN